MGSTESAARAVASQDCLDGAFNFTVSTWEAIIYHNIIYLVIRAFAAFFVHYGCVPSMAIYGTALGSPTPPPGDGHGSLPRPLWEWVGWLWMGGNAG